MKDINWKDLFEAMPCPCLVVKPEGLDQFIILEVNQAYLDVVKLPREHVVGKDSREAFPPNPDHPQYGHDLLSEFLKKVLETGEKQVVENLRYDLENLESGEFEERYFSSQNTPVKNKSGAVEIILQTIQETTQQVQLQVKEKLIQEELDVNRQHFRNFIRANPDGLFRIDTNGDFLHANQGLSDMADKPVEELVGTSFIPFCAPHHRNYILTQFKTALSGQITSYEADFISASGNTIVLKVLLMPMFRNKEVVEVHGIAKDVTDIRKTEKIMVEKSRFLEVNAAFISSLLENEINDEALHEAFGVIAKTVEADRMYYFGAEKMEASGEIVISQKVEWCSDSVASQLNNPELQNMPLSKIEEVTAPLFDNAHYATTLDELAPGAMKEIFVEQEIKSMLLLPIFLDESLYGFIGFDDCRQQRIWKEEEISFLRSLTQNLTNAFEKRAALEKVKRREEELTHSEQKFRALVQEGSDLIAILDIDGSYSFISENYQKILGFSPANLVGKNAYNFIHPDDLKRVREQFFLLKEQKQVKISPFRLLNSSGSYRWMQTVATNLLKDSAVKGIVTNSQDVTTIVEQAKEIEQINERYQLAATATQDLIYDWDLQNNQVTRFHSSLKELFGYPSKEVNDPDFWRTYIHPDDLLTEKRKLAKTLANSRESFIKTEYRFRRADGTYAQVVDRGYIIRNDHGKAIRLIGATSDISEITAKREELKVANKRFKIAMKATNEMIWDWDIKTDSVTRSKGYKDIFGYDTNNATSVHSFWLHMVFPEDKEKVMASLQESLNDPKTKVWKLEYRITKADGQIAYVNDRGYIMRDEDGTANRMVGAVLDVTNSRKLLRKIQKQNTVLKQIAWEQSHVVRAPLARIKGLVYLLAEGSFEDLSQTEIMCHIKQSTDELDDIIKNIVQKTEEIDVQVY
jgi:PAS domain S-box-containing protein